MFTTLALTDERTARRSSAAARWASDIAQALGLSAHEVHLAYLATLLHDVGMAVLPDGVFDHPGELDPAAWAMIQTHCEHGQSILNTVDELDEVALAVLSHHERYDGTGYPQGLAGEEIPLVSRIIAVADSYSAMVNDLPYRARLTVEAAETELVANKGTQFDPTVVDAFLRVLGREDGAYRRGDRLDLSLEFQKAVLARLDAGCPYRLTTPGRPRGRRA